MRAVQLLHSLFLQLFWTGAMETQMIYYNSVVGIEQAPLYCYLYISISRSSPVPRRVQEGRWDPGSGMGRAAWSASPAGGAWLWNEGSKSRWSREALSLLHVFLTCVGFTDWSGEGEIPLLSCAAWQAHSCVWSHNGTLGISHFGFTLRCPQCPMSSWLWAFPVKLTEDQVWNLFPIISTTLWGPSFCPVGMEVGMRAERGWLHVSFFSTNPPPSLLFTDLFWSPLTFPSTPLRTIYFNKRLRNNN